MNIVKSNTDNRLEQIQNDRDFVSIIIDKIFMICREDNNFDKAKKNVSKLDDDLNIIESKLKKQQNLIEKSKILKKDIVKKLSIIENENEKVKIELLRKMGSSI